MAILSINELPDRGSDRNWKNEANYNRTWQVVTNTPTDDMVAVELAWVAATGIVAGVSYPGDARARAKQIRTKPTGDDGCQWVVSCEYGKPENEQGETCPWRKPADISWDYSQVEVVCDKDIYDNPIVNSAKDPFSDPITIEQNRPCLSVRQDEQYYSPSTAALYSNCINSNSFMECGAGTLKVVIKGKREFDQQWGYYFSVSYDFLFNPLTWDKKVLDKGYRCLKDGKRQNILVGGVPATMPALLDGAGNVVAPTGQPYYHTFKVYNRIPFTFNFR